MARTDSVSRYLVGGGLAIVIGLFGLVLAVPAEAGKDNPKPDRPRQQENQVLADPVVRGIVLNTFWADGKNPGEWTPTIKVWSNESDTLVNVYGDAPEVREAIVNGTACVGRYVEAKGDRLSDDALSALGIVVPNLSMACSATLGPL